MQENAEDNNKKQKKKVQNLSETDCTETLLSARDAETKSRAKYHCNPRLAELIKVANILPYDFKFDWNAERAAHGFERAFEKFKKMFFELSILEQFELVGVDFGKNYIFFPVATSKKIKNNEDFRFCLRALDNSQEVIKIRKFLKQVRALFVITQEKEIRDLLSEDEDAFDAFNKLYTDIQPFYSLVACWKVTEHFRENFDLVNPKYRNGIMFYLTARYIMQNDYKDFGITDAEAEAYLEEWKRQFIVKDWSGEYFDRLTVILDIFAKTALTLEMRVNKVDITVIRDGEVKIEIDKNVEALQGVDISRLRICEYCKKLFWANRNDAYTCSPKHARNRRMRLLRENWKEKGDLYLKARQKKAKKQKEIKSNGSL
jgi:hypothetical protein